MCEGRDAGTPPRLQQGVKPDMGRIPRPLDVRGLGIHIARRQRAFLARLACSGVTGSIIEPLSKRAGVLLMDQDDEVRVEAID